MRERMLTNLREDEGFIARGGCAVIMLLVVTGAYLLDIATAALGGRSVPPGEHLQFWTFIGIAAVLTFGSALFRPRSTVNPQRVTLSRLRTAMRAKTGLDWMVTAFAGDSETGIFMAALPKTARGSELGLEAAAAFAERIGTDLKESLAIAHMSVSVEADDGRWADWDSSQGHRVCDSIPACFR